MYKTEFFETAVKSGFYGIEKGGLFGKRDNVRKYWEDTSIKLSVRPVVEKLLKAKEKIRIVDLGCGSGEGLELLTHIPPSNPIKTTHKEFILDFGQIESYSGLDISPSMIAQGKANYANQKNIKFFEADLSRGFPLLSEKPFDIYFSSYSSLSHLTNAELEHLTEQIFLHAEGDAYMIFDVLGRFSPEWPIYWGKSNKEMLPYNMAYLLPEEERKPENIANYYMCYWSGKELMDLVESVAERTGKKVNLDLKDRSIFVGRHMDTGLFNKNKNHFRMQTNRLFDRDYRGDIEKLRCDLSFLQDYEKIQPDAWNRICDYRSEWNMVIDLLEALMKSKNDDINKLIESAKPKISEELKMLVWLHKNSARFPVVDFWASIMGPQVACVLRNLELMLPRGLGCGHGLVGIAEIKN